MSLKHEMKDQAFFEKAPVWSFWTCAGEVQAGRKTLGRRSGRDVAREVLALLYDTATAVVVQRGCCADDVPSLRGLWT